MVTGTHCHSLKSKKADYGNVCSMDEVCWGWCDIAFTAIKKKKSQQQDKTGVVQ